MEGIYAIIALFSLYCIYVYLYSCSFHEKVSSFENAITLHSFWFFFFFFKHYNTYHSVFFFFPLFLLPTHTSLSACQNLTVSLNVG